MVTAQTDKNERDLQQAFLLDSLGTTAQALRILDRLVHRPDCEYEARMHRSTINFVKLHKPTEAFDDIGRAMQLAPDSMGPYLNRASFYLGMGMPDRALADLETGLARCRTASDSSSLYVNMGSALGQMRRFQAAVDAYDNALALVPGDRAARSNKAAVLDDLDRGMEAKEIYLALHEEMPNEIVTLNNLGFQASNRGDHVEALEWFEKARKVSPGDPVVLNNLGYAQLMTGAVDEALRNIQRSIKLYPSNSYAYRNLALAWQAKKEKDKACDAFEKALRLGFTAQYGPEVERSRREYCNP